MITAAQRLSAGALAVVLAALAAGKLLDVDGYASALSGFTLVDAARAWEVSTLLAAVELCAAALLLLPALVGRHAMVAFQGGAALAVAASLGYAILVVSAFYAGEGVTTTTLFGAPALAVPAPVVVAAVLALLSWSAWLVTSAFLSPTEPLPRRARRRRRRPVTPAG